MRSLDFYLGSIGFNYFPLFQWVSALAQRGSHDFALDEIFHHSPHPPCSPLAPLQSGTGSARTHVSNEEVSLARRSQKLVLHVSIFYIWTFWYLWHTLLLVTFIHSYILTIRHLGKIMLFGTFYIITFSHFLIMLRLSSLHVFMCWTADSFYLFLPFDIL